MTKVRLCAVVAGVATLLGSLLGTPAFAAAAPQRAPAWLDELHLGLLAHDVHFINGRENGADVNLEANFTPPLPAPRSWPWLIRSLLTVYPTVGADINTAGYTSQFYFGWISRFQASPAVWADGTPGVLDRLFFNLGLGGSLNDGRRLTTDPNRMSLGSHLLFHVSGEVGVRLTRRVDIGLYFDHASNAGLDAGNESINDLGMRVGWRF